jgi:CoA:oxalate CoA-transferase
MLGDLLKGVRVLDATNVLAGPLCTYLLALAGADVVKVEIPGTGDFTRTVGPDPALNARKMGVSFLAQNAGKRSITLNLKSDAGKDVFRRLARTSDVVVENFRPGVMRQLSLDRTTLMADNERLIYCAISGFGQEGPLAARPAYDHIIQGLAGGMTISGDASSGPMKAGFQFCDTSAAMMAAYAITAALLRRERTGRGAFLDIAMLDTTLFTIGWAMAHFVVCGEVPKAMGNHNFTGCPSGTFRTAKGLINIATNTQAQFVALAHVLGHPEWLEDARFGVRQARLQHRDEMTELIETELAAQSAAAWETVFEKAGVPAAPVLSIPEILAHEQIAVREFVHRFAHVAELEQPLSVPTAGFRIDGRAMRPASPPPALGRDTEAILKEAGLDDAEISRFRADGAI